MGAHTISHSVAQFLERQGVLERAAKNSYLQMDDLKNIPMLQVPFLLREAGNYLPEAPAADRFGHF